ncbi:uracil phosphoribosyltransferase [Methanofollis fontis]|uniref:Phosphoribosyltransferase domain-containing protein n=1 Tax=Methanofollis fontis TaxID=2052832 RepID=A0A483CNW4_9EURY|nr:uracil phosphoribosyltransferase [Methanofollis fontis]TAJ44752.1 hypothetical protein CUJ86_05500 [Methanofollis fontis]
MLKGTSVTRIKVLCILEAPEGRRLERDHPDVEVVPAAFDECLNEQGYILSGLGDAGDRLFVTG